MNVLDFSRIAAEDPEIAAAMEAELKRQRDNIELIASENFVSPAVMDAMGTPVSYTHLDVYKRQVAHVAKKYTAGGRFSSIDFDDIVSIGCLLYTS